MEHQLKDPSKRWLFIIIGASFFPLVCIFSPNDNKPSGAEKDPVDTVQEDHMQGWPKPTASDTLLIKEILTPPGD